MKTRSRPLKFDLKILGIDTSGAACSAALWRDGRVIGEVFMNAALTHSETVMPAVESLLEREGLTPKDMDCFAVVAGPGSFTGVRIGVCAVKALCVPGNTPCARIDALEALAEGTSYEGFICPILDARRDQVYCALFKRENGALTRIMDDSAMALTELIEKLPPDERVCFTGDGVESYKDKLPANAYILPPHAHVLRASTACFMAANRESEYISAKELEPIYLRLPQAERERAEKLTRAKL